MDSDETKPVRRERSITVDPERIVNDDPETDEAEEREGKGVSAILAAALGAANNPTEALRWLVLAYCALGEEAENPKGVLEAGIALIRAWRDAPTSMPELFNLAPEAFDLAVEHPHWRPWPTDQPKRYNGSGEPCDMWTGPCCCGATHKDGR